MPNFTFQTRGSRKDKATQPHPRSHSHVEGSILVKSADEVHSLNIIPAIDIGDNQLKVRFRTYVHNGEWNGLQYCGYSSRKATTLEFNEEGIDEIVEVLASIKSGFREYLDESDFVEAPTEDIETEVKVE